VLAQLQQEGLIKQLGLSTVTAGQIAEAQSIAPVVCVQNFYNLAHRVDDDLIDSLTAQGIAYVPYFPLGGFTPLQSDELGSVATRLDATPMAVALAWLLQRSPNILLVPGTSSVAAGGSVPGRRGRADGRWPRGHKPVREDRAAAATRADRRPGGAGLPMDTYYLLHATRADLLRRAGRMPEAAESYRLAADLAPTEAERRFLQNLLARRPGGGCAPADGSPGGQ
jgi:hypothetical protein